MKITFSSNYFYAITILILFNSCNPSSNNIKKKISIGIANDSCEFISEITSAFSIGAANGLLDEISEMDIPDIQNNGANIIPGYWCECYTFYVSKDLEENFSMDELREIRKDNLKKIMTLSALFKKHQEEIKNCILSTTNEKFKTYSDFERKLKRKLKDSE